MKNTPLNRALKLAVGMLFFVLVFNQLIGWAVTEKSWFEKLWITVVAGGGFGAVGAGIGLVIGGIGIALGGGAIGLAGWLAFGVFGFGAGALGGSVWTILQNPQHYDFDYIRLSLVVVTAITIALASVVFTTKLGRWIRSYIKGGDGAAQIEP